MLSQLSRISRRASHDMIMTMAKYGNGNPGIRFRSDADVKRFFAHNGIDYEQFVESCRDFSFGVTLVENLIPSTAQVLVQGGAGVKISRSD